MVSPERIRHRLMHIVVDEKATSLDTIYVDFRVNGGSRRDMRYYLAYDLATRKVYVNNRRYRPVPHKLKVYLQSILPPEILARCVAESITYIPADDLPF